MAELTDLQFEMLQLVCTGGIPVGTWQRFNTVSFRTVNTLMKRGNAHIENGNIVPTQDGILAYHEAIAEQDDENPYEGN